ncbi:hypothetical protein V6N13_149563 [Hibiscus sabdariffa]
MRNNDASKGFRQKDVSLGSNLVSLFVENLPNNMHWKGLWHMFARHGEVFEAFITNKLSRGEKRFGSVKVGCRQDALRIIERLNGFITYGYRLTVKFANKTRNEINRKRVEIRRGKQVFKNQFTEQTYKQSKSSEKGDTSEEKVMEKKKLTGHVEDEELWKLKRCLVGEMETVCSVKNIISRLQDWGLGEIKVQRLGGKSFLLFIEDDKLYTMLEDLNWSYLKEIFSRVTIWSDSMVQPAGATWLENSGVSLHSWNETTLNRIAELYGSFEAFGENYKHTLDCEKVTILITTKQSICIHELVDLEVGNRSYEVYVTKIGFRDDTIDPLIPKNGLHRQNNEEKPKADSSSESSSESGTILPPVENRRNSFNEEDVVNEMCVGKGNSINNDQSGLGSERKIGEAEILGSGYIKDAFKFPENREGYGGEEVNKEAENIIGRNKVLDQEFSDLRPYYDP